MPRGGANRGLRDPVAVAGASAADVGGCGPHRGRPARPVGAAGDGLDAAGRRPALGGTTGAPMSRGRTARGNGMHDTGRDGSATSLPGPSLIEVGPGVPGDVADAIAAGRPVM